MCSVVNSMFSLYKEYLMDRANPVLQTITELRDSVEAYNQDPQSRFYYSTTSIQGTL